MIEKSCSNCRKLLTVNDKSYCMRRLLKGINTVPKGVLDKFSCSSFKVRYESIS